MISLVGEGVGKEGFERALHFRGISESCYPTSEIRDTKKGDYQSRKILSRAKKNRSNHARRMHHPL